MLISQIRWCTSALLILLNATNCVTVCFALLTAIAIASCKLQVAGCFGVAACLRFALWLLGLSSAEFKYTLEVES